VVDHSKVKELPNTTFTIPIFDSRGQIMKKHVFRLITLTLIVLGLEASVRLAEAGQLSEIDAPAVPANIAVPAGHSLFLEGHAIGTQNFICLATNGSPTWRFTGPQATLFITLRNGVPQQISTHFLSANPGENDLPRPTWQHSLDSSKVWGRVLASSGDAAFVEPGSIPWLLLEVSGAQLGPSGADLLARTTFIHRLNTSGGIDPSTGCTQKADVGAVALVPYTADYFFYAPQQ
jgi:hypothetical protein